MRLEGGWSSLDEGVLNPKDFLGKSKEKKVMDTSITSEFEKNLLGKINEYNNLVYGFGEGGIKWEEFKNKVEEYLTQLKGDQKKLFETILWKIEYAQIGGLYNGLEDLVNRLRKLDSDQITLFLESLNSKESISWTDLGVLYGVSKDIENKEESNSQWVDTNETSSNNQGDILEVKFNPETFEADVKNLFDQLSIKLNLSIYDRYYQDFIRVLLEELKTYNIEQKKRFLENVNRGVEYFMLPIDSNLNKVTEFFRLGSLGAQLSLRLETAKRQDNISLGEGIVARESSQQSELQDTLGIKLRTYWYKHYIANMFGDVYQGTEMMKIVEAIGRADNFEFFDFFNPVVLKWIGDFEIYLSDVLSRGEIDLNDSDKNKKVFYNALYATFPYQLDGEFVRVFVGKFENNLNFQKLLFDTFNKIALEKTGGSLGGLDKKEFDTFLKPLTSSKMNFEIIKEVSEYDDSGYSELAINQAERALEKEKRNKLKSVRSFLGLNYLGSKDREKLENIINDMDIEEIRRLDYLIKISLGEALFDLVPEEELDMDSWLADNIGSIHGKFFEYFVGGLAASDGKLKELGKVLSRDSSAGILSVILDDDYIKDNFLKYLRDKDNLGEIKLLMAVKELINDEKTLSDFWRFAKDSGGYTSNDIFKSYVEALIGKKVEYDGDLLIYTLSHLTPDKSNLEELFINYRRLKDPRLRHFAREMVQEDIKEYVFVTYGEEFKKLNYDIENIDTTRLKISANSIQAEIGLFESSGLFKKLSKLDKVGEAADIISANYDFYIEHINASKLGQIENLKAKGIDNEVIENYKEKIQADIDISVNWPQDFDKLPSDVNIDYFSSDGFVNVVVRDLDSNETLIRAKGTNVEEANKNLLSERAGKIVGVGKVFGQPDDFTRKFKISLSNSKLSSEDLYEFTSKLSRHVVETFDKLIESEEGKNAFNKLPLEQKSYLGELYEQVVKNPIKVSDLVRYIDNMISKYNDKTNFFWRLKALLHTDPEKGIIDLGRLSLNDYSTYQTNKFFERKRDNIAKTKGILGRNRQKIFFRSLSSS